MTRWTVDDRYPRLSPIGSHDLDSLVLYVVAPEPARVDRRGREVSPARPPLVRVCGAMGGHRDLDAGRLRIEADRLLFAAELLDATGVPMPGQLSLIEEST